jgi:5-methyltetrahydrofolate--homocysteine methyltransferase
MKSLLKRLKGGEIIIADGAMGSLLMSKGLPSGMSPESFNLSHPEILTEIAELYFNAGAEIVQTNTFGGSSLKLSNYGLDDKTAEINKKAVEAVREAVGQEAYVSGSCGPTGKMLKPFGDTEPEMMYESFYQQLEALINAGIDVVCVETMTDINEALQAVKAARAISTTIPVMATMTFDPTPKGFFTVMGVTIEQAVQELEAAGASIIGSNCGNGIEKMIEIAKEFKKFAKVPLIIQSNAGLPELKDNIPVYPETPEFMAEKSKELVDAGVSIIGGCCGTTPDHIKVIKMTLKA